MANVVTIYHIDENGKITATGEFDKDKFETIPPKSTIKQPPKQPSELQNEVLRFNPDQDSWNLIADYRNTQYKDSDGNIHEITELGVEPKDSWTKYTPEPEPTQEEKRIADLEETVATLVGGGV